MPNITEFDVGNLAIRPSETGVEAFAAAGRRIGAFYNQAAESKARLGAQIGQDVRLAGDAAVAYMDHQQINAGADHASTMWANLQDSWNQTTAGADPHDPSVAKKWREEVLEPTLQQFTQGFSTEKATNWANERVNNLRQHFFTTTEADMSRMASVAVSNTVHNMGNNYTNAVMKDPSAVSSIIDQIDHSVDGVLAANPNIKGPDAARVKLEVSEKLKEQVVKSAVQGAILNGGNWQAIANKYPDYVDGAELKAFAKQAEVQDRALTSYNKAIQLQNRQLAEGNAEAARVKAMTDFTHTDPNTGVTTVDPQYYQQAKQVLMSGAPNAAATYEHMINLGHRLQNPDTITTDPAVRQDLSDRLMDTNKPTTDLQVRQAQEAGKLDGKQADLLLNVIKARDSAPTTPLFKTAVDRAKAQIEGTSAVSKLAAGDKYQAFLQQFYSDYIKARNDGTLKPDDLDFSKPDSLISQALKPYRRQLGTTIQQNGGVTATPAPTPSTLPRGVTLPPSAGM